MIHGLFTLPVVTRRQKKHDLFLTFLIIYKMQNENAGKTVEQIAAELNPYRKDAHSYDAWQDGYTTAQQSQTM